MKNRILAAVAIAGLVTLGACNKTPQAANVEAVTDNTADNMDAMASNASEKAENSADAVRAAGENKADAIEKAASNGASNATLNSMAKH